MVIAKKKRKIQSQADGRLIVFLPHLFCSRTLSPAPPAFNCVSGIMSPWEVGVLIGHHILDGQAPWNMANRYADPFCFPSVVSAGRHGVHEEVWRLENVGGGLGVVCPSSRAVVE